MLELSELVIEGFKKFGGEIIGGILLTLALSILPGLRKTFIHYADTPGTSVANYRKAVIFVVLVIVAVNRYGHMIV